MNDDFSFRMTPFDKYISNQSLQMLKLIIPFLPSHNQRMFAVYIKFLELRHTLSSFHSMHQNIYCTEDLLDSLKPYMSTTDAESVDQMMSMMSMMNMMQEMGTDPMGMMASMFAQDDDTRYQEEGENND